MPFLAGLGAALKPIAAPLITGIGSLLGIGATNRAAKRESELAYRRDLEMWRQNNEYNNPTNQMLRLKEAGLSPMMVYGGGNVTGNSGSQLPKYQAADQRWSAAPFMEAAAMIENYQNFEIRKEQRDNLRAQREQIEANTDLLKARGQIAYSDANVRDSYWKQKLDTSDWQIKKMIQEYGYRETMNKLSIGKAGIELDNLEKYQGVYLNERNRKLAQEVKNLGVRGDIFERDKWLKDMQLFFGPDMYRGKIANMEATRKKTIIDGMRSAFQAKMLKTQIDNYIPLQYGALAAKMAAATATKWFKSQPNANPKNWKKFKR